MQPPFLLAALASLVAACGPSGPQASQGSTSARESAPRAPREVRVAPAEEVTWERSLRVTGELVEHEAATLSTKVAGRVASIAVDLGTRVTRGAPIAEVESRDYELRVTQAEATLAAARALLGLSAASDEDHVEPEETALVRRARAELEDARREHARLVELQQGGVSAQSELDKSTARLAQAESALQDAREAVQNRLAFVALRRVDLEIARQALADTRIVAPFDGVVAERSVGTGDFLAVGAAVARLVKDDPLRLRLSVREVDAPQIRLGQRVRVTLDGFETPFEGQVARVAPTLDPRTRVLQIECDLPNPDGRLRPGSFARAEIVVDPTSRALVVPLEALVSFAGVDKVLVLADGVVEERRVVVGRRTQARVEILSGLSAGASVVLAPGGLQTGAPVIVAK